MIAAYRASAIGVGTGFLPDPGGSLDQSCWIMQAFGVIAAAEAQYAKDK